MALEDLTKNKIPNSKFQLEIDNMILEGKPSTEISRWLWERGEKISHVSISAYRKKIGRSASQIVQEKIEQTAANKLDEMKMFSAFKQFWLTLIEKSITEAMSEIDTDFRIKNLREMQAAQEVIIALDKAELFRREAVKHDGLDEPKEIKVSWVTPDPERIFEIMEESKKRRIEETDKLTEIEPKVKE